MSAILGSDIYPEYISVNVNPIQLEKFQQTLFQFLCFII